MTQMYQIRQLGEVALEAADHKAARMTLEVVVRKCDASIIHQSPSSVVLNTRRLRVLILR